MFKINDVIIYDNGGVCMIEDIGVPDFITTGHVYYKLRSLENVGSTIYVKLENKQMMRYTISKEEAVEYMGSIQDLQCLYNENSKSREYEYAEILKTRDYEQCLKMFKGIEQEKTRRSSEGKKLNANDDRNLQKVEKMICSEFSIAMEIPEEEVREKILAACN